MATVGEVVYQIRAEIQEFSQNLGKAGQAVEKLDRTLGQGVAQLQHLQRGFDLVSTAVGVLTGGAVLGSFIKSAALAAAQTAVLGTSIRVLGLNAGYTEQEIDAFEEKIHKTGISVEETRETMRMFIASNLDLSKAAALAATAQNIAAGTTLGSSQALGILTDTIVTGMTMQLRQIVLFLRYSY